MNPAQKAAEAFLASKLHPGTDSRSDNIKYGFLAGVRWHEQQVREMVEAFRASTRGLREAGGGER